MHGMSTRSRGHQIQSTWASPTVLSQMPAHPPMAGVMSCLGAAPMALADSDAAFAMPLASVQRMYAINGVWLPVTVASVADWASATATINVGSASTAADTTWGDCTNHMFGPSYVNSATMPASVTPADDQMFPNYASLGSALESLTPADLSNEQQQQQDPSQGSASTWNQDLRCFDHGCDGRRFSSIGNLVRHQKEQSRNLSARRYKCPFCDQTFTRSTARNVHLSRGRCGGANTSNDNSDNNERRRVAAAAATATPATYSVSSDSCSSSVSGDCDYGHEVEMQSVDVSGTGYHESAPAPAAAAAMTEYLCQATGHRCRCSLYGDGIYPYGQWPATQL